MRVNHGEDVQISFSSSFVATSEGRRYSAIFAAADVVVVVDEAKYRRRFNRITPPVYSHTTIGHLVVSVFFYFILTKPVGLSAFCNSI